MKQDKKKNNYGILLFFAIVLLICGVILSFMDKTASATATYGAAIMCLIFSCLNEFEMFEGLGIKAKLNKKLEEADETIKKIKEISLPLAEQVLTNTARAGRWSTMLKRRERYRLERNIAVALRKLDFSEEEIDKARKDCYDFNIFDLALPIWKEIEGLIDNKIKEKHAEISQIPSPISGSDYDKHAKLCQDLKALNRYKEDLKQIVYQENKMNLVKQYVEFINNCLYFSTQEKEKILSSFKEQLEDLKYYIENKEFRRLEEWFLHDEK